MKNLIIHDIFQPYGPLKKCHNIPYPDDYDSGYSSGYDKGYEKAKKEYESQIKEVKAINNTNTSGSERIDLNYLENLKDTLTTVSASLTAKEDSLVRIPEIDHNNYGSVLINPQVFIANDIPKQNTIPTGSKLCGYVEIDGTYHQCESCEHEKFVRKLVYENEDFRKRYFEVPASFFDKKPIGMLQEEYFIMKELGVVKISSFKDAPTKMIAFFYNTLTYKQTDLIYPR